MKAEKSQLTLDVDEAPKGYFSESSTVLAPADVATNLPHGGVWIASNWPATVISAAGTVNIGGTVFVYSHPSAQWYSIYPWAAPTIGILEDMDVPFRPKETRKARGVVVQRKRAEFKSAFIDELTDYTDID